MSGRALAVAPSAAEAEEMRDWLAHADGSYPTIGDARRALAEIPDREIAEHVEASYRGGITGFRAEGRRA